MAICKKAEVLPRPPFIATLDHLRFRIVYFITYQWSDFSHPGDFAESVTIFLIIVAVTEVIQNDEQREKMLHFLR